jgi:hypothetical protein
LDFDISNVRLPCGLVEIRHPAGIGAKRIAIKKGEELVFEFRLGRKGLAAEFSMSARQSPRALRRKFKERDFSNSRFPDPAYRAYRVTIESMKNVRTGITQ